MWVLWHQSITWTLLLLFLGWNSIRNQQQQKMCGVVRASVHAVVMRLFRNKGLLVCFAPLPVVVMDRPAISTFITVSLNCFFYMLSRGVGRTGVYLIDYRYLSSDLGNVRFMFSPFFLWAVLPFFASPLLPFILFLISACFDFFMHLFLNFSSF